MVDQPTYTPKKSIAMCLKITTNRVQQTKPEPPQTQTPQPQNFNLTKKTYLTLVLLSLHKACHSCNTAV